METIKTAEIEWKEKDKLFGLDYISFEAKVKHFRFDIRYDYDGNPKVKPDNCDLSLRIWLNGEIIGRASDKSIGKLKNYCLSFITNLANDILPFVASQFHTKEQVIDEIRADRERVIKEAHVHSGYLEYEQPTGSYMRTSERFYQIDKDSVRNCEIKLIKE